MPSEVERVCLECTLIAPQCDGKDVGCRFVLIMREQPTLPQHSPEALAKGRETRLARKAALGEAKRLADERRKAKRAANREREAEWERERLKRDLLGICRSLIAGQ
jgi:hypothetical protein